MTFRLRCGESLYAFCIGPELNLEHLYWGEQLHSGYDLRFLSQSSSRNLVFHTQESQRVSHRNSGLFVNAGDHNEDDVTADLLFVNDFEEMNAIHHRNRIHNEKMPMDQYRFTTQKRKENLSWRLMASKQERLRQRGQIVVR